jgi:uncharacterized Zn finger protein
MDYADYYGFRPYVPVATRRAQAARELATLKKKGRQISPVVVDGRKIAETFWGEAWCGNLERYSDFANRLPRGRTYVRNGSVVDLQVAAGRVTALVSGSDVYEVNVTVAPVSRRRWRAICQDCAGAIDSVVELLQGRFSTSVMARLCEKETGLFPTPKEIVFTCSCPDWASMCKHVAAVLYGIGARLDHQPELLFVLRGGNQQDLIAKAGSDLSKAHKRPGPAKVLESEDLSATFGIEIAPPAPSTRVASGKAAKAVSNRLRADQTVERTPLKAASTQHRPAPAPKRPIKGRLSATKRRAISERMKTYWAARRTLTKKPKG